MFVASEVDQAETYPGRGFYDPGVLRTLFLTFSMQDWEEEFTQGIDTNTEALAIGANIWGRSDEDPYYARNEFAGRLCRRR